DAAFEKAKQAVLALVGGGPTDASATAEGVLKAARDVVQSVGDVALHGEMATAAAAAPKAAASSQALVAVVNGMNSKVKIRHQITIHFSLLIVTRLLTPRRSRLSRRRSPPCFSLRRLCWRRPRATVATPPSWP